MIMILNLRQYSSSVADSVVLSQSPQTDSNNKE